MIIPLSPLRKVNRRGAKAQSVNRRSKNTEFVLSCAQKSYPLRLLDVPQHFCVSVVSNLFLVFQRLFGAVSAFRHKKVLILSFVLLFYLFLAPGISYSQIPERMHFQATIKDKDGNLLINQEVGARIKIITQSSEIFYQERHILKTNSRGLTSFIIGDGIEKEGNLKGINWADINNTLYIKIEIDPTGGKIYTLVYYNRIDPAPFALNANYVEKINETDPVFAESVASKLSADLIKQYDDAVRSRHYPGDLIGGGVVFYVDSTGENGLLATRYNIVENVPWSQPPFHSTDATSIINGEINTRQLLDQPEPESFAAFYCDTLSQNGKDDWYFPSADELALLFNARYPVNMVLGSDNNSHTSGIASEKYWSSSEADSGHAVLFRYGNPVKTSKDTLANIRAVRKFKGLYDVKNYMWHYLGGPENENGDDVMILENSGGDLLLDVEGKRGTVFRTLPLTKLPVRITFKMKTIYDPGTSEPPTELFGTGDFRFYFGGPNKNQGNYTLNESNLGEFEGVQFRLHPHLDKSPVRRYTGTESHTSTSIWIRYIDPDRILGAGDEPHTGLLSDACQNRNKPPTHNCGWARVALLENGLGLENGEETEVTLIISDSIISFEANGRVFSVNIADIAADDDYAGDILRFEEVNSFAIGHTNISRGYETIRISDLRIEPANQ